MNKDTLEHILLYLDDASINYLTETSKQLLLAIQKIETEQLYWKKRYEILSGMVLDTSFPNSDKIDWVDVVEEFRNAGNLDNMFIAGLKNSNYSAVIVALASGVDRREKPDLLTAIEENDDNMLSLLLQYDVYSDEDKNSALLKLCEEGYENKRILKEILASIKGPLTSGLSCFFSSINTRQIDTVNLILDTGKFDLGNIDTKSVLSRIVGLRFYKLENLLKYEIYGNTIGGMIIGYLTGIDAKKISTSNLDPLFEWIVSSLNPTRGVTKDKLFYYNLVRYILKTSKDLLSIIQLMTKIAQSESYAKKYSKATINSIKQASISVLNPNNKIILTQNSLYFVLRGLLLLSFQPQYTLIEVLNIIRKEGASKEALSMTGALIGEIFGINAVNRQFDLSELKNVIIQYLPKIDTKLLIPDMKRTLHHGVIEVTSR
jgi:hypothetical protein